ncbi:MAG: aminotransferase class I/II-fold pyridoxal phosphate-dependent enzyme [Synergistaceae bacterium]|jgi:threonine aldolase|nr:aminotransferase class I/II-fold pyridoxal phosphate-dependent enzyme [Synergistaceae bacterium]
MYSFKNDYIENAHPRILQALADTNMEQDEGYGLDRHSAAAAESIKKYLGADADIHLLCGGTQTNLIALSAFLRPHEAIIAAETAHICVHETGAIEATGHKILAVPASGGGAPTGKLRPEDIQKVLDLHTDEHMVKPRLVKISNSTEIGSVYSLEELEALSRFCGERNLLLYADGARLASALVASGVTLSDMRRLTDAFYIGGTKNGALLGEALVIGRDSLKEDFRYHIKQKGGLLAKGRVLGVQFEELFRDGLLFSLARHANAMARKIAQAISAAGYGFLTDSPSNQIFPILPDALIEKLQKNWAFYVWQKMGEGRSAIRIVTSWATKEEAVDEFAGAVGPCTP